MKQQWSLKKLIIINIYILAFIIFLIASLFYSYLLFTNYTVESKQLKKDITSELKLQAKNEVDRLIDIIYSLHHLEIPLKNQIIKNYVKEHRWGNKKNYIFIYKIHNLNNDKQFATMFANPNRPDLIGKFISTDYKDFKGNAFRKTMVAQIKKSGEAIVSYWYKALDNNEPQLKTSYFKLDKTHQFIVATGFYEPSLQYILNKRKPMIKKNFQKFGLIFSFILIIVILLAIGSISSFAKRIDNEINKFNTLIALTVKGQKKILSSKFLFSEFTDQYKFMNQLLKERKENVKKIYKEKELLNMTLENINDGVIVVDEDNTIILANKIAEKLTDISHNYIIGQPIDSILIPTSENNHFFYRIYNKLKNRKSTISETEISFMTKKGKQYIVNFSATNLFDSEKVYQGILFILHDMTEELKKNQILDRTQKLESLGILAGGIAHDFNNALAGILGNIELAKLELPTETKSSRYLTIAEKASYHARHLTNLLLTFARGGNPIKQICSIKEIIYDSVEFSLSGGGIDYHINIHKNLYNVEIDPGQIAQVIQNILINAKDAISNNGHISIECKNINPTSTISNQYSFLPVGKYIEIIIQDNGYGIAPENLNHIFDPYFTTKEKGNGLGLSICHSIIKKHKGYIFVKSTLGEGTSFFIYLPATNKNLTTQQTTKSKQLKNHKLLIMDDDPIILDVTQTILQKMGHSVSTATTGEEAIELYQKAYVEQTPFDLVILDLTIRNGMGGIETMRAIYKINPDVIGIASSGYTQNSMGDDQFLFKGFLAKPYKKEDLQELLNNFL